MRVAEWVVVAAAAAAAAAPFGRRRCCRCCRCRRVPKYMSVTGVVVFEQQQNKHQMEPKPAGSETLVVVKVAVVVVTHLVKRK